MKSMRPRWLPRIGWLLGLGVFLASVIAGRQIPANIRPAAAAPLSVQEPIFFPEFRATKFNGTLAIPGDARTVAGAEWALRLTDNESTDDQNRGAAWYTTKQLVGGRFHTTFQFRISEPVGPGGDGADGFAFVIQDSAAMFGAIGEMGCGLGYAGILKSIAIEFDTYSNSCPQNNDPGGDHIGIQLNGSPIHDSQDSLGTAQLPQNFVMSRVYTVAIHYEKNMLSIELDNQPVINVTVNIAEVIGSDTAWVGFTAGTGNNRENHDLLNWHFTADWGSRCADIDFTEQERKFSAISAYWKAAEGWYNDGHVGIDRGIDYYSGHDLFEDTGVNSTLVDLITDEDAPAPLREVQIHYTRGEIASPLTSSFDIDLAPDGDQDIISGTSSSPSTADQAYTENGEDRFIRRLPIDPSDYSRAMNPAGVRIFLESPVANDHIRIKRLGLCFETELPPQPLVMPLGARTACMALLENIRSRFQPYGPIDGEAQPELQFPDSVKLDTYSEYFKLRYDDGLLAPLTYTDATATGHAIVPCAFEENGLIYRVPEGGGDGAPIVRFTALGPDPLMREWLKLLNYAGHYALGQSNWCYPGDNAFALHIGTGDPGRSHSLDRLMYGPGYNIPPPITECDTGDAIGTGAGPCGTFVGSLYRAMGYFNISAFSDPGQLGTLRNLYYGVLGYTGLLPEIGPDAPEDKRPFVRVDASRATYTSLPINFSAIRVYARDENGQRPIGVAGVDPVAQDANVCVAGHAAYNEAMCYAVSRVGGNWSFPVNQEEDIVLSPLWEQRPANVPDAQEIWQAIRPGDISITVIDKEDETVQYPHVQIVVGWGPIVPDYSREDARTGQHLYTTYQAVPEDLRLTYVPYVADRYKPPVAGIVPRPFNYDMLHTSTEFWVANYTHP